MKTLLTILLTVLIFACDDGITDSPVDVNKIDTTTNTAGYTIFKVRVNEPCQYPILIFWLYNLTDSTEIKDTLNKEDYISYKLDNNKEYKYCHGLHITERFCDYFPDLYMGFEPMDGDTFQIDVNYWK